jgi:hypothetical protein
MPGGIQPGTVAMDKDARTLDKHCKSQAEVLRESLVPRYEGRLTAQVKLRSEQIPNGKGACQPDGLAWFWDGELIAVFEAKKQQNRGNAIERWYKNNYICRKASSNVSYVTFAIGAGAYENGTIGCALSPAHDAGFDVYVPGGNSCFMNKSGFTESEVRAIMLSTIEERIKALS